MKNTESQNKLVTSFEAAAKRSLIVGDPSPIPQHQPPADCSAIERVVPSCAQIGMLQSVEHRIRDEAKLEVERLENLRRDLMEKRAPFDRRLQERAHLAQEISRAESALTHYAQKAKEFKESACEAAFKSEGLTNCWGFLVVRNGEGFHAERIMQELSRWIEARRNLLSAVDADIIEMAQRLGTTEDIPPDVAHTAIRAEEPRRPTSTD